MDHFLNRIIDGLDFETFIKAESEKDAEAAMLELLKTLGFKDADIVFVEHQGSGVRVRARTYIHRPGDQYGWFTSVTEGGSDCET